MPYSHPIGTRPDQEASEPPGAACPERGLILYGDPHGDFQPLLSACAESAPEGVILLGDCELQIPLREQIAPLLQAGIRVFWISGNHDARSPEVYDHLWSDHPEGNLHTRRVELGGMAIAGIGGVFKGRIWRPEKGEASHHSRSGYLEQLPRTDRWRGGLPLRLRDAIFPEDLDMLASLRADVVVSHEAPSCHRYGQAAIDRAARSCGARLIVHGHHHQAYEGITGSGMRVRGLARAEVFRLRPEDLR